MDLCKWFLITSMPTYHHKNGLVSTHVVTMSVTASHDGGSGEVKEIETFPRLKAGEMKEKQIEDIPVYRYNGLTNHDMPESESAYPFLLIKL